MKVVGAAFARDYFARLLAEVQRGESFTITRRGKVVAQLVSMAGGAQRPWGEIVRELAEIRRRHPVPKGSIRRAVRAGRR